MGLTVSPAHYLPASRAALLDLFDMVVSSLIDKASSPTGTGSKVTSVVSDFMNQLVRIGAKEFAENNSRVQWFEERLLAGRLSVHQDEAMRFPCLSAIPRCDSDSRATPHWCRDGDQSPICRFKSRYGTSNESSVLMFNCLAPPGIKSPFIFLKATLNTSFPKSFTISTAGT